jgi:hypothetical protein
MLLNLMWALFVVVNLVWLCSFVTGFGGEMIHLLLLVAGVTFLAIFMVDRGEARRTRSQPGRTSKQAAGSTR